MIFFLYPAFFTIPLASYILFQTKPLTFYFRLSHSHFISDIVFVSVLNLQHYEVTKLMLENGKHVLCEKPMGMTYKQTKSLVDLAREKKLFLLEGMWSRFFPAYDALDKHITSGGLGDIYHINVQFGVEINDIERNLYVFVYGIIFYYIFKPLIKYVAIPLQYKSRPSYFESV